MMVACELMMEKQYASDPQWLRVMMMIQERAIDSLNTHHGFNGKITTCLKVHLVCFYGVTTIVVTMHHDGKLGRATLEIPEVNCKPRLVMDMMLPEFFRLLDSRVKAMEAFRTTTDLALDK